MNKTDQILEELELDYIERIHSDMEVKKAMLPLTKPSQIKGLIWNLLMSDKFINKISMREHDKIMGVLFERLKENETFS